MAEQVFGLQNKDHRVVLSPNVCAVSGRKIATHRKTARMYMPDGIVVFYTVNTAFQNKLTPEKCDELVKAGWAFWEAWKAEHAPKKKKSARKTRLTPAEEAVATGDMISTERTFDEPPEPEE